MNLLCADLLDNEKFAFVNKNINGEIEAMLNFLFLFLIIHTHSNNNNNNNKVVEKRKKIDKKKYINCNCTI